MKKHLYNTLIISTLFCSILACNSNKEITENSQSKEYLLIEAALLHLTKGDLQLNKLTNSKAQNIFISKASPESFFAPKGEKLNFKEFTSTKLPAKVKQLDIQVHSLDKIKRIIKDQNGGNYLEIGNIRINNKQAKIGLCTYQLSNDLKLISEQGCIAEFTKEEGQWKLKKVLLNWEQS